jgi:hypothetical protein
VNFIVLLSRLSFWRIVFHEWVYSDFTFREKSSNHIPWSLFCIFIFILNKIRRRSTLKVLLNLICTLFNRIVIHHSCHVLFILFALRETILYFIIELLKEAFIWGGKSLLLVELLALLFKLQLLWSRFIQAVEVSVLWRLQSKSLQLKIDLYRELKRDLSSKWE